MRRRIRVLCAATLFLLSASQVSFAGVAVDRYRLGGGTNTWFSQILVDKAGDTIALGGSGDAGLETVGPPLARLYEGVLMKLTASGEVAYSRYLGAFSPVTAALAPNGDIWALSFRPGALERVETTYDLAPGSGATPAFLVRLDGRNGCVLSVTRILLAWSSGVSNTSAPRMAVDSRGAVWLGGVASTLLPVTPDAAQDSGTIRLSQNSNDQGTFPGSLIRFSPNGDSIEYATYLGDGEDAVSSIAIDGNGNVYAVGSRIWKFASTGKLLWSTWIKPGAALVAAVDEGNDLYIGGCTTALQPPLFTTPNAFQSSTTNTAVVRFEETQYFPKHCVDGFVARFSPEGEIKFSTLLGGARIDLVNTLYPRADGVLALGYSSSLQGLSKDIYWRGSSRGGTFIASLDNRGTSLEFLTPYLLGTAGEVFPSAVSDGELRIIDLEGRVVAGQLEAGPTYYRVTLQPRQSPIRIDDIRVTGSFEDGYSLEIIGDSLGASPSVTLDDVEIPIESAASDKITTGLFPIFAPKPDAYYFQLIGEATYQLRVQSGGETSRTTLLTLRFASRPD